MKKLKCIFSRLFNGTKENSPAVVFHRDGDHFRAPLKARCAGGIIILFWTQYALYIQKRRELSKLLPPLNVGDAQQERLMMFPKMSLEGRGNG